MPDSRDLFFQQLEHVAEGGGSVAWSEIVALLRRAAILIRNTDAIALDTEMDAAITSLAELIKESKQDTVRRILRDWLTTNGYLPRQTLSEDSEVAGSS